MAVIYYQLAIVTTLIFTRVVFPKRLRLVALIWTGLTIINLFYPPLIFIQLAVIWGGYVLLRSRSTPLALPMPAATVPMAPNEGLSRSNMPSARQLDGEATTDTALGMNVWLIRNRYDHEQYWDGEASNWDMLSLSTQAFTDDEKAEHELPPGGEWVRDDE